MRGYRPELDAARFLAFFLVFLLHASTPASILYANLPGASSLQNSNLLSAVFDTFAVGLSLFFALSAYLITKLLLTERADAGSVSIPRFYVRRLLRIWPLYFLGILVGLLIAAAQKRHQDVVGFCWYLLFAGNIYCGLFGWPANPMTPLWSISIEEQFYLTWPWAMRWFSFRGLVGVATAFVVAANCALYYFGGHLPVDTYRIWVNSFVQFEMFAAGILLALFQRTRVRAKPVLGFGLVAAGLILFFVTRLATVYEFSAEGLSANGTRLTLMAEYVAIAVGCAMILQGFCTAGPGSIPIWMTKLGKISYGLYVFHVLALDFARALLHRLHGMTYLVCATVAAFVLTVALAQISYVYFESPFLRLKRRFETVHSRPV